VETTPVIVRRSPVARKPNYGQNRAERQRQKEAKRNEKLEAKREKAARRKEQDGHPEEPTDVPAPSE
jgi:hypothetical protein